MPKQLPCMQKQHSLLEVQPDILCPAIGRNLPKLYGQLLDVQQCWQLPQLHTVLCLPKRQLPEHDPQQLRDLQWWLFNMLELLTRILHPGWIVQPMHWLRSVYCTIPVCQSMPGRLYSILLQLSPDLGRQSPIIVGRHSRHHDSFLNWYGLIRSFHAILYETSTAPGLSEYSR